MSGTHWTEREEALLEENIDKGLSHLSKYTFRGRRSATAIKHKLQRNGESARDARGHLSKSEVCQIYQTSIYRVNKAIREGMISARKIEGTHFYFIDPASITKEVEEYFRRPKQTWVNTGFVNPNYNQQNKMCQIKVDGINHRIPLEWKEKYGRNHIINMLRIARKKDKITAIQNIAGKDGFDNIQKIAEENNVDLFEFLEQAMNFGIRILDLKLKGGSVLIRAKKHGEYQALQKPPRMVKIERPA